MWSFGPHFRRHDVDVNLKICDYGVATGVNTPNSLIDHVGVIEDMIEVTIGGSKDIVLKVNWYAQYKCNTNLVFFQLIQHKNNFHKKLLYNHLFTVVTWSKYIFVVDGVKLRRSFVLQSQIMKHIILRYRGILSLNDESQVHGLMAGHEQETIPSNHEDNEAQRYLSDESFSVYDSENEADYANDVQNVNFTSDEDSQIGSWQLRCKFVFTFISYISTTVVIITITNNISHIMELRLLSIFYILKSLFFFFMWIRIIQLLVLRFFIHARFLVLGIHPCNLFPPSTI